MQIADLKPGTSYAFRMRACVTPGGQFGDATLQAPSPPPSYIVVCATASCLPSAPHPPAVLASTSHSLTLRWVRPAECGGSSGVGYRLALRPSARAPLQPLDWKIVYEGEAEEVAVPGLAPAHKYTFQLQVRHVHVFLATYTGQRCL
jgi:Fibronectin type III domain